MCPLAIIVTARQLYMADIVRVFAPALLASLEFIVIYVVCLLDIHASVVRALSWRVVAGSTIVFRLIPKQRCWRKL